MLSTPQIPPDIVLSGRLQALRARIEAAALSSGRSARDIGLLAVSKGQPVAQLRAALALGLTDFGENYVNEALPKIKALAGSGARWHFIGRVQTNKTRHIATSFDWVHSIDRLAVAQRLADQRPAQLPPLNVCVQVGVIYEPGKAGCSPLTAPGLMQAITALPTLRLRGLMCMLPFGASEAAQQEGFGRLRKLYEAARDRGLALDTLSMGMSDDLEGAVAEGTNLLRIGSALFGPRPSAATPAATPVQ